MRRRQSADVVRRCHKLLCLLYSIDRFFSRCYRCAVMIRATRYRLNSHKGRCIFANDIINASFAGWRLRRQVLDSFAMRRFSKWHFNNAQQTPRRRRQLNTQRRKRRRSTVCRDRTNARQRRASAAFAPTSASQAAAQRAPPHRRSLCRNSFDISCVLSAIFSVVRLLLLRVSIRVSILITQLVA